MLWFVVALILLSVIASSIAMLFLPGVFTFNPNQRVSYEKVKKRMAEEEKALQAVEKDFKPEVDSFAKTN